MRRRGSQPFKGFRWDPLGLPTFSFLERQRCSVLKLFQQDALIGQNDMDIALAEQFDHFVRMFRGCQVDLLVKKYRNESTSSVSLSMTNRL
tara:strand:- start:42 stop:314 length:273 start_codon:yes stop_codon:yes gene_type:complete